mgnify:CR=1 FL=1
MNNDFSQLITYLDEKFNAVDARLDHVEQSFSDLQGSVDAYAKKADTYFQEMAAMRHAISRHEEWLQQIAKKVGLKLDF